MAARISSEGTERAAEWLLVIDMQRAFGDPDSGWFTPGFQVILPKIERLIAAYAGRVILTRYVPPNPLTGAWREYFGRFQSLILPPTDPAWDLLLPHAEGCLVATRDTFRKWDETIAALTGPDAPVAICGVATECCVLATALAAIDDGRCVRIVEDACAGATSLLHEQAMRILAAFAPLVGIVRSEQA